MQERLKNRGKAHDLEVIIWLKMHLHENPLNPVPYAIQDNESKSALS
jgi:hypothetical protein